MLDGIKAVLITFGLIAVQPVSADSAAAWKAYQEGRDPLMEVGLLVIGVVIFFSLLVFVNKVIESRNRKKKKNKPKRH